MNKPAEIVDYYLSDRYEGSADDAFHGLVDTGPVLRDELINVYDNGAVDRKVLILQVISEFGDPEALWFLKHTLRLEPDPIWKSSLSGLVGLASIEAIDALEHVLCADLEETKRSWIEEAIADIQKLRFPAERMLASSVDHLHSLSPL